MPNLTLTSMHLIRGSKIGPALKTVMPVLSTPPAHAHAQPKEIGLPFTAYSAIDEVREVRKHLRSRLPSADNVLIWLAA